MVPTATEQTEGGEGLRDDEICNWYYSNEAEAWSASCGYEFVIYNETPAENGMNFCPHCGGVLKAEILH